MIIMMRKTMVVMAVVMVMVKLKVVVAQKRLRQEWLWLHGGRKKVFVENISCERRMSSIYLMTKPVQGLFNEHLQCRLLRLPWKRHHSTTTTTTTTTMIMSIQTCTLCTCMESINNIMLVRPRTREKIQSGGVKKGQHINHTLHPTFIFHCPLTSGRYRLINIHMGSPE